MTRDALAVRAGTLGTSRRARPRAAQILTAMRGDTGTGGALSEIDWAVVTNGVDFLESAVDHLATAVNALSDMPRSI